MALAPRGWSCSRTCQPNRPCYASGCLNAFPNHYQGYNSYYNAGFRVPNPNFQGSYFYYMPYNQASKSYYNRRNSGTNYNSRPNLSRANPPRTSNSSNGTVRIGVGNRSETDINIDVYDNMITGGRNRVHLGSRNHAALSNTGIVANNKVDADDVMIGADNYSEGGDNDIRVRNTDFSRFDRVRVGSGNFANGSNRIVVDGLSGFTSNAGGARGNSGQNGRNRWSSWLGW